MDRYRPNTFPLIVIAAMLVVLFVIFTILQGWNVERPDMYALYACKFIGWGTLIEIILSVFLYVAVWADRYVLSHNDNSCLIKKSYDLLQQINEKVTDKQQEEELLRLINMEPEITFKPGEGIKFN